LEKSLSLNSVATHAGNHIRNSIAIRISRSIAAERVSPSLIVASNPVMTSGGRLTVIGVLRFSGGMVFRPMIGTSYRDGG
jgi:hypothetical protein